MKSPRRSGLISIAIGLALASVSAVMVWKVVPAGTTSKVVASGFLLGLFFLVKGGVEVALNERWSDLSPRQIKVLQVLGFLSLAAIAVGIAYYGMEME